MAITTNSTGIANLALPRIGLLTPIGSITDTKDAAARACNTFYELVRQQVLRSFWWRWATKRAVLAELSAVSRQGWGYVYNLPADCLHPQYIWSGRREDYNPKGQRVPFDIESDAAASDASKRILLTDMAPVAAEAPRLSYTVDHTSVTQWPAHFVDALAWRLAAEVAVPLSAKADKASLAFQLAAQQLTFAIAVEQQAREAGEQQVESNFTNARR